MIAAVALWAGLAVAATAGAPASKLAEQPDVAAAIAVLDAWLEGARAAKEEPGLSIAIVHDQDVVWAKGYGLADIAQRRPATAETLYRIASVSKLFTATAVLQLRDAGALSLDDPVEKHLPWFHVRSAGAEAAPITIRHLLTHTSGLARELPLPYWNDLAFPSREEMIRLLGREAAVFPPETEWKYSNLALAVAGEVVAAAAHAPYEDYVRAHVLEPLGMSATRVHPDAAAPGLAVGYRRRVPGEAREAEDFIDTRALTPAASFASSVLDLARLVSLQFRDAPAGNTRVLKAATLREMQRPQWLRPDWQSGQGLGFWLRRVGGQLRVGHDGAAPGYRSQLDFDPATKIGVIVLSNAYDADPRAYVDQAFAIVGPALAKATETPKPVPSADPAWSRYVGAYTWKHADVQVHILAGELTLIVPDAANPWESRVRLAPVGPHTFKMIGGSASGELARFEADSAGRVTRLFIGSVYRVRKEAAPDMGVAEAAAQWWRHQIEQDPGLRVRQGLRMERLPEVSPEAVRREADFAQSILGRLRGVRAEDLSHEDWLTLKILSWEAQATIDQSRFYWSAFAVTPYASRGILRDPTPALTSVHDGFRAHPLATAADRAAYLALLRQYPGYIAAHQARLAGQRERGSVIAAEELDAVVALVRGFARPGEESLFQPPAARLSALDGDARAAFGKDVADVVRGEVNPALVRFADWLDGAYRKSAPAAVGAGQYPGGQEYYRHLVRLHTTLDLTPEEIHRTGQEEMARIQARMSELRARLGVRGPAADFHRRLESDPRFLARTPDEVGARLMSYVERIRPHLDAFFLRSPRAPYGVKRLDPALEGTMTYGYYQKPTAGEAGGHYMYNGSDLPHRSLLNAAALIAHELVPGHHFQMSLQLENDALPELRRQAQHTAFIEGWGLYSSLLAAEMGLYADPYDEYGMLSMDAFLTSRLVVDTGMNALGWSRARAAAYMQENTLESDEQIRTETLRYSTDIPGQALAYKIGAKTILRLREKARSALGPRFDIRAFHDAVLGSGSMPLSVLEEHVDWFIRKQQAEGDDRRPTSREER